MFCPIRHIFTRFAICAIIGGILGAIFAHTYGSSLSKEAVAFLKPFVTEKQLDFSDQFAIVTEQ